jgi:SAM-dependent methyltransferase
LSDGVNLGVKTGFNSGATLDYVYANKASGRFLLGKLLDGMYLNSPGWTGIRQRKINLEEMIKKGAADLKTRNMPLCILDVAAGRGRYILDVLEHMDDAEFVLLRDYNRDNVGEGLKRIIERGLEDKVKFEVADAFDVHVTASAEPKPTLVVVSGFYEIFPENDDVKKSLEGISLALEKGGLLVYTAQPWHPQLEMIARTLRDWESPDKPWVMRGRSQGEMDALVEQAGFVKKDEIIDQWGMFSVSLAEKL